MSKREKVKIVFVGSFLVDYTIKIAKPMARRAEILLIADNGSLNRDVSSDEIFSFKETGAKIITFCQNRIWNRWWSVIYIASKILVFKPDAVVFHEHVHPHLAFLMQIIAKFAKIILIVHDPKPHIGRDADFANKNKKITCMQRKLASAFVVHGDFCKKSLREQVNYNNSPIYSISMGPNFSPEKYTPIKFNRTFLMFGRMEMYKGLDLLLNAMKILISRGVDFNLRLAGRGPELDRLYRNFVEVGCCSIESKYITKEEAIKEFADADFLVAPYLEATQSGVVALAFASGRPVVATNVGGLADFVINGENGILVEPGNPEQLANALQKLIDHPSYLDKLASGAVNSGKKDHSWDKISNDLFIAIKKTIL